MKEGSEALVGGPPLNLSVGQPLVHSGLGSQAGIPPLLLWRTCCPSLCPWASLTPHLLSKVLSAAAQPTCGGFLAWEVGAGDGDRKGEGRRRRVRRCTGSALGPVIGSYLGSYCSPCPATGVYYQVHIGSVSPTFPGIEGSERLSLPKGGN